MTKANKITLWVLALLVTGFVALFVDVNIVPWLRDAYSRNDWDLWKAIEKRDVEIVQKRLTQYKNINAIDDGNALLLYAIRAHAPHGEIPPSVSREEWAKKRLMIVELLLNYGADPNICDNYWERPAVSWAAYLGNNEIVELLLEKGANLNIKDKEGQAPLHIAARQGGWRDVMKPLIDKGANVNAKDNAGHTPLYYAVKLKNEQAIKLLRENGGVDE